MPYRKKVYKKYNRNGNGRPGYSWCAKMVLSDGAKALAMAKYLKGLVNVEFKQITVQATAGIVGTSAVHTQLTNLSRGDDDTQRDGNAVRLKSVHIKGFIKQDPNATQTTVRLVLVHDKQTNQALATFSDIYFDNSAADAVISPRNIDNMKRFVILWDHNISLSVGSNGTKFFNFYKQINIPLRYDGNAGDITDLTQSSLQFIQVSDEGSDTPDITFSVRLRFVDN